MNDVTSEQDRIESELRQTRSRMDDRLTELRDRMTPGQILDDVTGYLRGSQGADFADYIVSQTVFTSGRAGLANSGGRMVTVMTRTGGGVATCGRSRNSINKPKKPTSIARVPIATPTANPASSPLVMGRSNPAGHAAGAEGQVPSTARRRGTAMIESMP